MHPPARKSLLSKGGSILRTVQLVTIATFAAFLFVTLNQSLNIDRRDHAAENILQSRSPFASRSSPVVDIKNGRIRGTTLTSRAGRSFSAFYEIPYAEPPLGKLRFQPPQPYTEKWDGIRDATLPGGDNSGCVQYTGYEILGSEDCLKLNVYTPQLPTRRNPNPNLPVMFYILGGAFKFGQASKYGAEYMMDEDVILVNFDFRVGAFAHLNTEDGEVRGNQALKDQVMALKWVKENIAKFGGDPKRVLIFGNSSGASYVSAQVISRMGEGLFHAAVSQSGSVYLASGYRLRPLEAAQKLGQLVNCSNTNDTKSLHSCLIQTDPVDLALKYTEITDFPIFTKEFIPESNAGDDTFFVDHPINLLTKGDVQNVPWLVGNNNAEGFQNAHQNLNNQWALFAMNNNWNDLAPLLLNFEDDANHTNAKSIREMYFGTKSIGKATRYGLVNLMSDIPWVNAVRSAADLFAKNGGRIYYYFFTHEPKSGFGDAEKIGFSPPYGVAHADEVQFFFPWTNELHVMFPYIDTSSTDYKTSINIIKIWTSFAAKGYPSAPGVNEWPAIDQIDPRQTDWMEINDDCKLVDPLRSRMKLLETIRFRTPMH